MPTYNDRSEYRTAAVQPQRLGHPLAASLRRLTVVALLVLLALPGPPSGRIQAQSTPGAGPEFQVNTFTTDTQQNPAIDHDSTGNVVMVWNSVTQDGDGGTIIARRYLANGDPASDEIQINATTTGDQTDPAVAAAGDGSFVVAWTTPGADDTETDVVARRFNQAGAAVSDEFRVNTVTADDQFAPAVAGTSAGNFVVAWTSRGEDGSGSGIFAQRFDTTGTPQGTPIAVNTFTEESQSNPAVAMDANGNFVIAWSSFSAATSFDIFARRFTAAGDPQDAIEFQVNTFTESSQNFPAVASNSSGTFVIAWTSNGQDGASNEVYARRYAANGQPASDEFRVNTDTSGNEQSPALDFDNAGNLLIAWKGDTGDAVYAQRYTSAGRPVRDAFQVNTAGAAFNDAPAVAVANDGTATIVWQGQLAGGEDSAAIIARSYAPVVVEPPAVVTAPGSLVYTEGDPPGVIDPTISVSSDNSSTVLEARATISTGYVQGQDVLSATDQLSITSFFDGASGSLILTGTATLTNYQTVLRTVRYVNTSIAPNTDNRTVTFTVDDGTAIGSGSRGIQVVPVNSLPVITTTPGSLTYLEGSPATALDPGLTISDLDNTTLVSASVAITAGLRSGQDVLSVLPNPDNPDDLADLGLSADYDNATGILRLSGNAPLNDYQAILRRVAYRNTSQTPDTTPRQVAFLVDDGLDSVRAGRGITITTINDGPTIGFTPGLAVFITGQGPIPVDAALTLSDPEGDLLREASVTVSSGYIQGQDVLTLTTALSNTAGLSISGGFNPATGVYTFTGTAPASLYQQVLRTVVYTNTSSTPDTTIRTLTVASRDVLDAASSAPRRLAVLVDTPGPDAPVVIPATSSITYTEGADPVVLDPQLTLAIPDGSTLLSATIAIDPGFRSDQDVLTFPATPEITPTFDSATGELRLRGTAPVTTYQTLLRQVAYHNTSANPDTTPRTLALTVDRGGGGVGSASYELRILAVNNRPALSIAAGSLSYTEGSDPLPIAESAVLSDTDNANLQSATIAFVSGYVSGEDVLAVNLDSAQINETFNSATGVLSLTGTAPISSYQQALRAVTYANTSGNPDTGERQVRFQISDGSATTTASTTRAIQVVAVDSPPTVRTTSTTLEYTEEDPPTPVDPGIVVEDPDSSELVSATVRLAAGYVPNEDVLAFTDQNGIEGSFEPATGRLTLLGSAAPATYQAALRSITFVTSNEPTAGERSVTFAVSDGTRTTSASRSINVVTTDLAPRVVTSLAALRYTEGDGAVPIDPAITVSDGDNENLAGATVSITAGYAEGEDVLALPNQEGITSTFDVATGMLTINGTATVAAYQSALQAVTYANTSSDPDTSQRTVTFSVSDGRNAGSGERFIDVEATDDQISNLELSLTSERIEQVRQRAQLQQADLSLIEVETGAQIEHTAIVTNTGPADASTITVTLTLPQGIAPTTPDTIGEGSGWDCTYTAETGAIACGRATILSGRTAPILQIDTTVGEEATGQLNVTAQLEAATLPPGNEPIQASTAISVTQSVEPPPPPISNTVYLPLLVK